MKSVIIPAAVLILFSAPEAWTIASILRPLTDFFLFPFFGLEFSFSFFDLFFPLCPLLAPITVNLISDNVSGSPSPLL